jgi:hypothetical protein
MSQEKKKITNLVRMFLSGILTTHWVNAYSIEATKKQIIVTATPLPHKTK